MSQPSPKRSRLVWCTSESPEVTVPPSKPTIPTEPTDIPQVEEVISEDPITDELGALIAINKQLKEFNHTFKVICWMIQCDEEEAARIPVGFYEASKTSNSVLNDIAKRRATGAQTLAAMLRRPY